MYSVEIYRRRLRRNSNITSLAATAKLMVVLVVLCYKIIHGPSNAANYKNLIRPAE